MKFRQMNRDGLCSVCYSPVKANSEIVVTARSDKHKKLVVICAKCAMKIYNEIKKGEVNG